MVNTVKFSGFSDGGDLKNADTTVGLSGGANARFNNPWTFLAAGDTASRPAINPNMYYRLRFNTENNNYEFYNFSATAWQTVTTDSELSFITGSILFAGPLGLPDQNNAELFWNVADQLLGVGTNNPNSKLHLKKISNSSTPVNYISEFTCDTADQNGFAFYSVLESSVGRTAATSLGYFVELIPHVDDDADSFYAGYVVSDITSDGSAVKIGYFCGKGYFAAAVYQSGDLIFDGYSVNIYPTDPADYIRLSWNGASQSGKILVGGDTPVTDADVEIFGSLSADSIIFNPVLISSNSQSLENNKKYICDNGASLITFTLPLTANAGDEIDIIGASSGGFTIHQNAGQSIHFDLLTTTVGAGGSLSSSAQYNQVKIICVVANTEWVVHFYVGTLSVV